MMRGVLLRTLVRFLIAFGLIGALTGALIWYTQRELSRTADYCRAHGYIGYSLGGRFIGPSCIDHDNNMVPAHD